MDEYNNHDIDNWLIWLVTGFRWCVMLPSVAIIGITIGFLIGRL